MKCTNVRIKNVLTKAKISTVGQTGSVMVTYNRCDYQTIIHPQQFENQLFKLLYKQRYF